MIKKLIDKNWSTPNFKKSSTWFDIKLSWTFNVPIKTFDEYINKVPIKNKNPLGIELLMLKLVFLKAYSNIKNMIKIIVDSYIIHACLGT